MTLWNAYGDVVAGVVEAAVAVVVVGFAESAVLEAAPVAVGSEEPGVVEAAPAPVCAEELVKLVSSDVLFYENP